VTTVIGTWLARRAAPALLLLGAAFSFVVESGWLIQPVTPRLQAIDQRLGDLEVLEAIPFDLEALGEQPPEGHAYLAVRAAQGREGRLFLAYYEHAKRWSGRPHDLEGCYAAAGWRELEAERLDEHPFPWVRTFEREGDRVRVVHWIDHPGPEPRPGVAGLVARLTDTRGLRRDVVAVYLEFPLEDAPDDSALSASAAAVSTALERLW
jgi:hypothetical protein